MISEFFFISLRMTDEKIFSRPIDVFNDLVRTILKSIGSVFVIRTIYVRGADCPESINEPFAEVMR